MVPVRASEQPNEHRVTSDIADLQFDRREVTGRPISVTDVDQQRDRRHNER